MIQFSKALKQSDPLVPEKKESAEETSLPASPVQESKKFRAGVTSGKVYETCREYMAKVSMAMEAGEKVDLALGRQLVEDIISKPETLLEELYFLTHQFVGTNDPSLATHAVNVMIASLILGRELGYARGELEELGVAALFHGTGMYLIPRTIRNKEVRLSDAELAVIKEHPEKAYAELRKYGQEYYGIAEVIRQEHERIDGSGYPYGLEGEQIHEHAFIIGLLDIYQALINSRPYREKRTPTEAMKEIVRRAKGLFPKAIIKKLLIQLSIYPVNSYVRLNNSSIGMVVKTNNLWPLKPIIRIIHDAQGTKLKGDGKIIDLSKSPLLHIKNVVSAADVE